MAIHDDGWNYVSYKQTKKRMKDQMFVALSHRSRDSDSQFTTIFCSTSICFETKNVAYFISRKSQYKIFVRN